MSDHPFGPVWYAWLIRTSSRGDRPSFGEAGPSANFTDGFSRPARFILAWMMLVGRLEIYTVLILFHPETWKSRKSFH